MAPGSRPRFCARSFVPMRALADGEPRRARETRGRGEAEAARRGARGGFRERARKRRAEGKSLIAERGRGRRDARQEVRAGRKTQREMGSMLGGRPQNERIGQMARNAGDDEAAAAHGAQGWRPRRVRRHQGRALYRAEPGRAVVKKARRTADSKSHRKRYDASEGQWRRGTPSGTVQHRTGPDGGGTRD